MGAEGSSAEIAVSHTPLASGIAVIRAHQRGLPATPGVYRMINAGGDVLYVGKAKYLSRRVASYTRPHRLSTRLMRMIAETASMEFVTTHTEAEALLLEANLIKRYAPRYNVLLRDDKSFPSILLTADHRFPQVLKHRGAHKRKGQYFGPFASAWAVNHTLTVLQRAFLLRSCSDSVFESRTRPCLLFQIKRCCAPCVGRVSDADYGELMTQARSFLTGNSLTVQQNLAGRMQGASDNLEYERAAHFRDRIRALTSVQAHQDINLSNIGEADVMAAHQAGGQTCIQVFFFRAGRNYGNHAYYPIHGRDDDAPDVLEAFIAQFYADRPPPRMVMVSHDMSGAALLAEALSVKAERIIKVTRPQRGDRRKLVAHALANAREALARRLSASASQRRLLEGVARVMNLEGPPDRIEIYDNSHIQGGHPVGAMVVCGPEGFVKGGYRKFNIRANPDGGEPVAGDDYAMMRQVLNRRFSRALREDPDRSRGQWPDLVLIDGGPGQLGAALSVCEDLAIDDIPVVAISKGPDRDAGRERFHIPGRQPFSLELRDPVLYFLQRMRDEAHRFAIGSHRDRRSRSITRSPLDEIPGIGAKRKKALLHHFGSARAAAQAGRADLRAVPGVSGAIADRIYEWFHPND